jgi:peptidoglycan/LPS O-acetylase OafA/YrhL
MTKAAADDVRSTPTVEQAGEVRSAQVESLRALAALGVLVGHVYGWSHLYGPEVFQSYVGRALLGGGFGVSLFFTLSGYLLFLPFARATWGTAPPVALGRYALNRALRVLPLYYVVIAFFLVVQGQELRPAWWRFALLLESFWSDSVAQVDGPVWSLLLEVQFYALLPLLALGLARGSGGSLGRAAVLLLALGSIGLVVRVATVNVGHPSEVWRYSLPAWAVFFVPGLLLALVRVRWDQQRPSWADRGPRSSPLPWILISMALLLVVFHDYRLDALLLPAWFVLVGACVLPLRSDRGLRWLGWRPLSLLGVASYSLYLWHEPLVRSLRLASWMPDGLLPLGVTAGVLSIAVAFLSYHLVEAPFLRLRRQWHGRGPAA